MCQQVLLVSQVTKTEHCAVHKQLYQNFIRSILSTASIPPPAYSPLPPPLNSLNARRPMSDFNQSVKS